MATSSDANRVLYLTASATTTIQSYSNASFLIARRGEPGEGAQVTGYPMTGTLSIYATFGGGGNYSIRRSVVWLDTPELFGDIDGEVVLRLLGSGSEGVTIVKCDLTASEPMTATEGLNGYAPYIWDTIDPGVLFSTAVSSSLTSSAYTDITLNSEAKRWILSGSEWSRQITSAATGYGVALGIINYSHDYLNVAPVSVYSSPPGSWLDTTGSRAANGPSTSVSGVWMTGSRGAEPKYTKYDYTIAPYDNDITRYPRRIPQTPYGLSIKGPISLRKKNVPYKVTT
tara:strand:+ start:1992 stop:2846 length:855 start_codon:yes stop_codon:yes gene_type:complete